MCGGVPRERAQRGRGVALDEIRCTKLVVRYSLGHGSKPHTPSEHPNPHKSRLKWVVHLSQKVPLVLNHGHFAASLQADRIVYEYISSSHSHIHTPNPPHSTLHTSHATHHPPHTTHNASRTIHRTPHTTNHTSSEMDFSWT